MTCEAGLKALPPPEGRTGLLARLYLPEGLSYGRYRICFMHDFGPQILQVGKLDKSTFSYDVLRQPDYQHNTLRLPSQSPSHSAPNEETLHALYSISKTPYMSSFASRLLGGQNRCEENHRPVHRDWETRALWMDLLSDIRLHHYLRQ